MNFILSTKRLQLRPCSIENLTVLHALWTNERIRYFLFDDRLLSEAEAKSLIECSLDSVKQYQYGLWLVHRQEHPIGFVGLLHAEAVARLCYRSCCCCLELQSAYFESTERECRCGCIEHGFGTSPTKVRDTASQKRL